MENNDASKPIHPHIRSYVLRQGRLSQAQARAIEEAKLLTLDYQAKPLNYSHAFSRDAATMPSATVLRTAVREASITAR